MRNCGITQLVVERGGRLGSGLEALDVVLPGVRVIFRASEVRGLEYPPGPIFR